MTFGATVVRVLIASPGDTVAQRRIVKDAIEDWNSLHAEETGVVLLAVMWERDATPEMGERPQGIINRQLVDTADVLVGLFWTRLGTPTEEADSGTVEEIERFIEEGKPVLLYFSKEPVVPDSVDQDEYARLQEFKQAMRTRGLFDSFSSEQELWRKINAALTRTMRDHFSYLVQSDAEVETPESEVPAGVEPHASLLARVERERELRNFSRAGRPRYRTRERLLIENVGDASAENLSFSQEVPDGVEGEPPHVIGPDTPIAKLPPGGSIDYPMATVLGSAAQWDVVFTWEEDGKEYRDRQSMR